MDSEMMKYMETMFMELGYLKEVLEGDKPVTFTISYQYDKVPFKKGDPSYKYIKEAIKTAAKDLEKELRDRCRMIGENSEEGNKNESFCTADETSNGQTKDQPEGTCRKNRDL